VFARQRSKVGLLKARMTRLDRVAEPAGLPRELDRGRLAALGPRPRELGGGDVRAGEQTKERREARLVVGERRRQLPHQRTELVSERERTRCEEVRNRDLHVA
jgi:hypothetical protein